MIAVNTFDGLFKLDENNIFRITLKHTLIQRENFEIVFGKGKVEAQ